MVRFLVLRAGIGAVLVLLVSVLVFSGTQVLPGDAANAILGRSGTAAEKAAYRRELGLDRPLASQYWRWASRLIRGDLGRSFASQEPVSAFLAKRAGNTLILAFATLVIVLPVSLALGIFAGVRRGRPADHVISTATLGLIALPEFVTGTILIALLAVYLGILPPTSIINVGQTPFAYPRLLVLPVLTLSITAAPYLIRMVRAGVAEAMESDYVQQARLNGVPEARVVLFHGLPNALAPTVQVAALTLQYLIGGVVIVETLFAYPGLGAGLVEAVDARDIPTVQGTAMVLAALYIVINIIADLGVVLIVPKLRTRL